MHQHTHTHAQQQVSPAERKNSPHWLALPINLSQLTERPAVMSGVGAARGCIKVNQKNLTTGLSQSGGGVVSIS
jgi:hypothetical protein